MAVLGTALFRLMDSEMEYPIYVGPKDLVRELERRLSVQNCMWRMKDSAGQRAHEQELPADELFTEQQEQLYWGARGYELRGDPTGAFCIKGSQVTTLEAAIYCTAHAPCNAAVLRCS